MYIFKLSDSNGSFTEQIEANDVEEAYQMMYEEYPDFDVECIGVSDDEEI